MRQPGMKFVTMKIPYIFMFATWCPIFLLVYIVPDNSHGQLCDAIEKIIDQYLFSRVGMWSSAFPLSSKLVTNYLCLVAPPFAIVFTFFTLKNSTYEQCSYADHSVSKMILLSIAWMVVVVFFIYGFYMDDTDLNSAGRRFVFLGQYKVVYALFSAGTLYVFYMMSVASCFALKVFPAVIMHKIWLAK